MQNVFLKEDTALNGIYYYYNDKTNYLIDTLYKVNYDVFKVHYFSPINIPNKNYYQQLSTSGSACKDMVYNQNSIFKYQRTNNLFAPYCFDKYNTRFFQNKKAYTSIDYSGSTLGNQYFRVNFAKNLYKGLNLQTEYFVNYADGDFDNSQVMNQFFNFSLNYISPLGRYRNNFAFDHNRAYILENNGIKSDSIFRNNDYSSPDSYPINSEKGWSKWKTSEFSFSQTFRLNTDTTDKQNILNLGAIVHNSSFFRAARLYDDENKTIKDSVGTNLWTNSVFWTNNVYGKQKGWFIPISIGVNMDFVNFNDSVSDKWFSLISPEIRLGVKNEYFNLKSSFARIFSSSNYDKDYQLNIYAKQDFRIEKNLYLFANFISQKRQPDYIFTHYFNEHYNWENIVNKTKTNSVSLGISLNDNFILEAKYSDIKDYYCLNSNLQIENGDTKIMQLFFKNNILIGRWRLMGSYILQKSSKNIMHLPLLALKQGFSYQFSLFQGKLKSEVGADLYYYTNFKADAYNPEIGIFLKQNQEKIGNYLYTDMFLNINIKQFCMFIMLQHPYAGMFNHNYFNTPLYPSERLQIRYGLTWKLLN